jgi:hypothetical protein
VFGWLMSRVTGQHLYYGQLCAASLPDSFTSLLRKFIQGLKMHDHDLKGPCATQTGEGGKDYVTKVWAP